MLGSTTVGPVGLSVSVIIPTMNRPDHLRDCMRHVQAQTVAPIEIVVVDSSSSDSTCRMLMAEFPGATYARNEGGLGKTPESRNMGLHLASGDVLAFVDDDANARPDWLAQLLKRYSDPRVGGVGGSVLNGVPGERDSSVGGVGLLLPDGSLIGNFAAHLDRDIAVDHLLGANMSFRRAVLISVGGIRGGYPGTCLREETDIALRVSRSGYSLLYAPDAVVDHFSGPYAKGRRFDRRYVFYANRNHVVLLVRNFGYLAPIVRSFYLTAGRQVLREIDRAASAVLNCRRIGMVPAVRTIAGALARACAQLAGLAVGTPAAVRLRRADRSPSAPSTP